MHISESVGIVLGRFQPLHWGHILLMREALAENSEVVICVGSAQCAEPLTFEERRTRIINQLELLKLTHFRIVELLDPEPLSRWPEAMYERCGLDSAKSNVLYRSDRDLSEAELGALRSLGVSVKFCERRRFPYRAPDGLYYEVSSASEIKAIHRELGLWDHL